MPLLPMTNIRQINNYGIPQLDDDDVVLPVGNMAENYVGDQQILKSGFEFGRIFYDTPDGEEDQNVLQSHQPHASVPESLVGYSSTYIASFHLHKYTHNSGASIAFVHGESEIYVDVNTVTDADVCKDANVEFVKLSSLRKNEQKKWILTFAKLTGNELVCEILHQRELKTDTNIHVRTHHHSAYDYQDFPLEAAKREEDFDQRVAATYVLDAAKGRVPIVRIQQRGAFLGFSALTPLSVYTMLHHRYWRWFMSTIVFGLQLLGVFEHVEPDICASVEFLLLTLLLTEALLKVYSHDSAQDIHSLRLENEDYLRQDLSERSNSTFLYSDVPFMRRLYTNRACSALSRPSWTKLRILLCCQSMLDIMIWALIPSYRSTLAVFRVTRVIRPFFLIEKGRVLRKLSLAILYTLPYVLEVVVLFGQNTVSFGILGFLLFSEKCNGIGNNPFFKNVETSIFQMFLLITADNYPDIMMESYAVNRWVIFFFVAYLLSNLYLQLNIILATVYSKFQLQAHIILSEIPRIQTIALCAAFSIQAYTDDGQFIRNAKGDIVHMHKTALEDNMSNMSTSSRNMTMPCSNHLEDDEKSIHIGSSGVVASPSTMQNNPKLNIMSKHSQWRILAKQSEVPEVSPSTSTNTTIQSSSSSSSYSPPPLAILHPENVKEYIPYHVFHQLFRLQRPKQSDDHVRVLFRAMDSARSETQSVQEWVRLCDFVDVTFKPLPPRPDETTIGFSIGHIVYSVLYSPVINILLDMVFLGYFLTVIVHLDNQLMEREDVVLLAEIQSYFTIFECFLRIFSCLAIQAPKKLSSGLLHFDTITGLVGAFGYMVVTEKYDIHLHKFLEVFICLRVFRLLRHLMLVQRFRRMMTCLNKLFPALRSLFLILIAVYYFFAVIGVDLFSQLIVKGNMPEDFMRTYYANNNFWANNFDDLTHAFGILFELQIVNNWSLMVDAFTVASKDRRPRVFFCIFFFCTVIVMMNVVVALLLEAFISKQATEEEEGWMDDENQDLLTAALLDYMHEGEMSAGMHKLADANSINKRNRVIGKQNQVMEIVTKKRTQRLYKMIFER